MSLSSRGSGFRTLRLGLAGERATLSSSKSSSSSSPSMSISLSSESSYRKTAKTTEGPSRYLQLCQPRPSFTSSSVTSNTPTEGRAGRSSSQAVGARGGTHVSHCWQKYNHIWISYPAAFRHQRAVMFAAAGAGSPSEGSATPLDPHRPLLCPWGPRHPPGDSKEGGAWRLGGLGFFGFCLLPDYGWKATEEMGN